MAKRRGCGMDAVDHRPQQRAGDRRKCCLGQGAVAVQLSCGYLCPHGAGVADHGALPPDHRRAGLDAGLDPGQQRVLAASHGATKQRRQPKGCCCTSFCMCWWSSRQENKLRFGFGKVWLRLWRTRVRMTLRLLCRRRNWMLRWPTRPMPPPRGRHTRLRPGWPPCS